MEDMIVQSLIRNNIPVTRENYIKQNWSPVPSPWTPEHEEELPEQLQDWSVFPGAA